MMWEWFVVGVAVGMGMMFGLLLAEDYIIARRG